MIVGIPALACFTLIPPVFLPVTPLGILFGYLVVRTGSILTGMAFFIAPIMQLPCSFLTLKAQSQASPFPDPFDFADQLHTPAAPLSLLLVIGIALLVFISWSPWQYPHLVPGRIGAAPGNTEHFPFHDDSATEDFDEFTELKKSPILKDFFNFFIFIFAKLIHTVFVKFQQKYHSIVLAGVT